MVRRPVLLILSLVILAGGAAVPTGANHGSNAVYAAGDPTCSLTAYGEWVGSEFWEPGLPIIYYFAFDLVMEGAACGPSAVTCVGRGNIEQGFVRDDARSSPACANDFRVGGTGHWHTCCDPEDVDVHTGIPVTYGGATVVTTAVIGSA